MASQFNAITKILEKESNTIKRRIRDNFVKWKQVFVKQFNML